MIGLDDYTVHEERQLIGRIRFATATACRRYGCGLAR